MRMVRLVSCGAMLFGFIAGRILYQFGAYWAGRRGYDTIAQNLTWLWVTLGIILFVIGAVSLVLLAALSIRDLAVGKRPWRQRRHEAMFVVVAMVGTLFLSVFTVRPASRYFLPGFQRFIDERANLGEIRRWFDGISAQPLVPSAAWPPSVAGLSPAFVSLDGAGRERELTLVWGGGMMHWGLTLCETPPVTVHSAIYNLKIDDRSYVWVDSD